MDLSDRYFVWWTSSSERTAYSMTRLEVPGVKSFEMHRAEALASRWPADATATLDGGDPKAPMVEDCLLNTKRVLIVSERLKAALEAEAVPSVEYLPVALKAKEGPLAARFYFVHLLERPDCLDLEASGAELDDETVEKVKRLVLKSDPQRPLFMLANYPDVALVSVALAERLTEIGFSGVRWLPLFNHPNFDQSKKEGPVWKRADVLSEAIAQKGQSLRLPSLKGP